MKSVEIIAETHDNVDWATTPDAVQVCLYEGIIKRAEAAIEFMQAQDASYVMFWYTAGWELLEKDYSDIGEGYIPFDSKDFRIGGCHIKVYRDGDITAVMPLKHCNDEEIWANLGKVGELKEKLK